MAAHRLPNYVKAFRKRSGLTQSEVAFLLGNKDGAQLSRYEKDRHIPRLKTAFAFEKIFGATPEELFAGLHDSVNKEVSARIDQLAQELENRNSTTLILKKRRWLADYRAGSEQLLG